MGKEEYSILAHLETEQELGKVTDIIDILLLQREKTTRSDNTSTWTKDPLWGVECNMSRYSLEKLAQELPELVHIYDEYPMYAPTHKLIFKSPSEEFMPLELQRRCYLLLDKILEIPVMSIDSNEPEYAFHNFKSVQKEKNGNVIIIKDSIIQKSNIGSS